MDTLFLVQVNACLIKTVYVVSCVWFMTVLSGCEQPVTLFSLSFCLPLKSGWTLSPSQSGSCS